MKKTLYQLTYAEDRTWLHTRIEIYINCLEGMVYGDCFGSILGWLSCQIYCDEFHTW